MLVNKKYNDQNIIRVRSKMSEHFSGSKNIAKLPNENEDAPYFADLKNEITDNITLSYDHIYATNEDKNESENSKPNCQNAESEVRFLKEWLLIHLDLIQQQNDDILSKEKTIFYLQQENEMLKERIRCMEIGTPFQSANHNNFKSENFNHQVFTEDMTQDSGPDEEGTIEKSLNLEDLHGNCDIELLNYQAEHEDHYVKLDEDSQLTSITSPNLLDTTETVEVTSSDIVNFNSESVGEDTVNYNNIEYKVNSPETVSEVDSMKNLRMSIRRKRLCSNSSVFSNNDNSAEEKTCRRQRRKRKRCFKDEEVLTSEDLYHNQVGDMSLVPPTEQELAAEAHSMSSKNLEVPHWRVKVYASCYTMEGTENLEDAVFNRRHSRLEVDERRRKRWDVQRIREQRIIEKLKQRQERSNRGGEPEPVHSLWPAADDVKFIELCNQLPVSSMGGPIVKSSKSEFNLPWTNGPPLVIKKSKRLIRRRRKGSKR